MAKLRGLLSLILLLLLAAGVSLYVLRGIWNRESAAPLPGQSLPATAATDTPKSAPKPSAALPPAAPSAAPAASAGPDYAQRFRETTDNLEFARSIHAAAKAGDADARYYLYRALDYCQANYRLYFGHPARPRTLDEALRYAVISKLDVDEVHRVHQRCRNLVESGASGLGQPMQWLGLAAQDKQPNAQLAMAQKLLTQAARLPEEKAGQVREDARLMVGEAVGSRDPEVIFDAAILLYLREGAAQDDGDMVAWWLAACERGLDCGPSAERTRQVCGFVPNCQPYESLVDMIRREVPDFGAVETRARELNRLIDAGDLKALGFGARDP